MAFEIGLSGFITLLSLLGVSFVFRDYLASFLAFLVLKAKREIREGVRIKVLDTRPIKGDVLKIGLLRTTILEVGDGERLPSVRTGRHIKIPNHKLMFTPVLIYGREIIDEVIAYTQRGDLRKLEEKMSKAIRNAGCQVVSVGIYQKENCYIIHGMYKISPETAADKRSEILLNFIESLSSDSQSTTLTF